MKASIFLLLLPSLLLAKTEIIFWHAFEGFPYNQFAETVADFNHQSKNYEVKLIHKGNYTETFDQGIAACEAGHPPHILQVYEVATHLFYNKTAFKKAGLNPECPPKTWEELEKFGLKLVNAGYKGFITAWPVAYHLEHLCSWHNLPFATHKNGFDGLSARLDFNKFYQVRHISKLASWQKSGIFSYQGRSVEQPEKCFSGGECAILLQGSNRFPMLSKTCSDSIGVGFMPYWADSVNSPFRLNIGGSSFWAMAGLDEDIYRGIAHFFAYLSLSEVQAYWYQKTGFLPITEAAYYLTKKKGFYTSNCAAEIAVLEVMNDKTTPYTKGIRLGNYTIVRDKILEYLEKAFAREITAQEALDKAVQEGNKLLADFEKRTRATNTHILI
jgi:sn-glycerol 3-phosphate transport system substrate-binding protein